MQQFGSIVKGSHLLQVLGSSMDIGLCWYQNETNNKWTYDLTDHLMVDLKKIITLACMTHIVDVDAYELHLRDEKMFNKFINEC